MRTVVHRETEIQGNEQQKQYTHHQGGKVEDGIKEAPQLLQTTPCFKERQTTLSFLEGVNFIHLYTFEATEGLLSYQRTYP